MIRWHVISAVGSRNLKQYFSSVLGYVIIVAFVAVSAILTFSQQFFADNLANLDQLTIWFPMLLLFLAPAISMSVWADERRSGTDAILFTLPASDLEILLGKYFAVAAVFTISLLFSMTQLIALNALGEPDWGVIFATYFGYWLAGLALLSIGMFASSLTESSTVAFVLGALFCSIPVLLGSYFQGMTWAPEWLMSGMVRLWGQEAATAIRPESLGVSWNLYDFSTGLIPASNVFYFVSLVVFMLYLNLVVISRRHWSRGQQVGMGGQFAVRIVSLFVALISLNSVVAGVSSSSYSRVDLTQERLFSLDQTTLTTLNNAKENKKLVTIQAFVSADVPRKFVNTRKQLLGLLRQFDFYGGNYVEVRVVNVTPNSEEQINAERLGITGQNDRSEVGGRMVEQQIFMGTHISSDLGDSTLPAITEDTSLEYELTRAIASTTDKNRQLTIGIVDTDARFGGPEFDGRRVPWAYTKTLKQLETQFKIVHISQDDLANYVAVDDPPKNPDDPASAEPPKVVKTPPSVLLVPDPSSLTDTATESLVRYLQAGYPTLLLTDPLPFYWTHVNPTSIGILNAPSQPRVSQMSPYREVLSTAMMPKADNGTASKIMTALGLEWNNDRTVWSLTNPHPGFQGKWPEYLGAKWPDYYGRFNHAFVYAKRDAAENTFDSNDKISKDLKELLFFYPGAVRKSGQATNVDFVSLISLGQKSGAIPWSEVTMVPTQKTASVNPITQRRQVNEEKVRSQITGEDLYVLRPAPRSALDNENYTIAAHVKGTGENKVNAVVVCDLDFVSDLFYDQQAALDRPLDNVKLMQNAIEVLAGEEGFVTLRGRRPTPRTLSAVEFRVDKYREHRAIKQAEIEDSIRTQLEAAQASLNEKVKGIEQNTQLSFLEKLQQASQEADDSQAEFDRKKVKLDRELSQEIAKLKLEEQRQISSLESGIQWFSVVLVPLPALMLGLGVFFTRKLSESGRVRPGRKV